MLSASIRDAGDGTPLPAENASLLLAPILLNRSAVIGKCPNSSKKAATHVKWRLRNVLGWI